MTRLGMVIDAARCLGCDQCLMACKDEFEGNNYSGYSAAQNAVTYGFGPNQTFGWPDTPPTLTPWVIHGQNWMDIHEEIQGSYPAVKVRYVATPCFQCENAPCLSAATNNAMVRRSDGILLIDPAKAVGQKQIVTACPYGRVYWNPDTNIPQKCTFCAHLVDQGKQPRCVEICPVSAITFGDLDDPTSAVSLAKAGNSTDVLHPEYGARPKVSYIGLPKPFLSGKVVNGRTGKYVQGAVVTLTASDGTVSTSATDVFGDFEFKALRTGKTYTLQASYTGMFPKTMIVFLDMAKDIGKVSLSPM